MAFHGHNLLPYLLPIIFLFIMVLGQMSIDSGQRMFSRLVKSDVYALLFFITILALETYHSGGTGLPFSFRIFLPLFFFLWVLLYLRKIL